MNEAVRADLFVEDRAHEDLLKPIVLRIARETSVAVTVRVRSARGGHAKAMKEFALYQDVVLKGALRESRPELVIVAIDGNCSPFARKRAEIEEAKKPAFSPRLVVACPDPHIERWYLADPDSFARVVGHRPVVGTAKCARDHYKRLLAEAVRQGGYEPTLGGVEFAADIAEVMDLYRVSKGDHSFKAFLDDLRGKLLEIAQSRAAARSGT